MKTLVLFNNKGGVGKTTLVYHLAHMLARLGHRTLAVDLDPQANLTSAFFDDERLEKIWTKESASVLAACNRSSAERATSHRQNPLRLPNGCS